MDIELEKNAFKQVMKNLGCPLWMFELNDDGDFNDSTMAYAWCAWKAKAESIMQWIDINERMPEHGQKVLIYRPFSHEKPYGDPNFKIATYCGEGIWINSHFKHEITHWMPLLNPSKEQNQ
ncbi:DUF551 domain-containing protein [Acinetobacter sp. WCHAc010034]|uniref:DUF551 domain-containing protein n=1 Tax=Acinetobacter sp. WCHAc010034 TaxID=1879049 RepID=UPI00083ACBC8|nr:DUF551 domain-containing protein [Acinetobacter sp. WCHAc010034]AYA02311.1 DUF551 domain-containing protein [Acinetobacter sp. WCHAc010034]